MGIVHRTLAEIYQLIPKAGCLKSLKIKKVFSDSLWIYLFLSIC